jgi:hypothetical protein
MAVPLSFEFASFFIALMQSCYKCDDAATLPATSMYRFGDAVGLLL